ncbi:MAG TPA: ankyrin repeat domain-containing protein [Geminicoccaceae bacterium]|nr:ankyrin repeat domain-containing protein [Geminicoccaceae bacterium]
MDRATLIEAVKDDDVGAVERLLGEGGDPNLRDPGTGLTPLLLAACHANPAVVRLLLDAGADVFTADSKTGATALHKACQGGSVEVAEMLLDAGAFVDAVAPTTGHTPIMDALWYKWPEMVRLLVDRGADLNLGTHYGFSMMDHFQFELNVNTLGKERLLEIDRIFKDRQAANERTIAEQVVMARTNAGDAAGVREAIEAGADVNTVYPIVNSFNDGHTPLLVAARDNHGDIVELLLGAGAEVRVEDWVFKGAPIHKATYNGNADILRMLLKAPDIDINVQGKLNGYTPLHDALWHGYAECATVLIEAGARLDLKGHDGKRPIDIATEVLGPDHEVVRLIRSKTASRDGRR